VSAGLEKEKIDLGVKVMARSVSITNIIGTPERPINIVHAWIIKSNFVLDVPKCQISYIQRFNSITLDDW
jgi:hypothetical protein